MAAHRTFLRTSAASLLGLTVACAGSPPPEAGRAEPEAARPFLSERAFESVRRQVAIGRRDTGTPGASAARAHFRTELEKLGLTVDEMQVSRAGVVRIPPPTAPAESEHETGSAAESGDTTEKRLADDGEAAAEPAHPGFVHVRGIIPGSESSDIMLLAAAYDTAPKDDFVNVAANGSASGPALVLELARAIAARPLPYETWVVFLDGDGGGSNARERPGSRAWAAALREAGELRSIRLAFFFRQVCDPDLRFERDLFSHRVYRQAAWRVARRQGETDAFPPDSGYTTPAAGHISLLEVGVRRVVAFVDDAYGGTEAPGAWAGTVEDSLDHCAADSMGVTGKVVLQTLDDLSAMLLKVDRLAGPADEPVAVPPAQEPAPEAHPAADPAE